MKAEQKHEDRRRQRNQRRAQHHARAQPRAQRAAALVRVELENVPQQQHQQRNQQQEDQHGEAGKDQRLAGGLGIQKADIGGVERLQTAQQRKQSQRTGTQKTRSSAGAGWPSKACGDYSPEPALRRLSQHARRRGPLPLLALGHALWVSVPSQYSASASPASCFSASCAPRLAIRST